MKSCADTFTDSSSGKDYPGCITYTGRDPDDELAITLDWSHTLVAEDLYAAASSTPDPELGGASQEYDRRGIRPTYARYLAHGSVHLKHAAGTLDSTGEAVCELNHPGREPAPW